MNYNEMSQEALIQELNVERKRYEEFKSKNLSYDLTRGKPGKDQLDLSNEMLSVDMLGDNKDSSGTDCRNYGIVDGIGDAKKLFTSLLQASPEQIIVGGNASLALMHDIIVTYLLLGTGKDMKPWIKSDKVKFICPVPGYDRHFAICEKFGIEMINVPILEDGPDMDVVEELVASDPAIKGMWSVPKYSNPTGIVYSDEVIDRIASMNTKAPDFRVFWDDAYTIHFLKDGAKSQKSIISACEQAGNPHRALVFTSTSKITFPGAGISAVASSVENVEYLKKLINIQTIGYDKLNQLRHVNFLKDHDGIVAHMKKHAAIMAPKFDAVLSTLESELAGLGILKWYTPEGGYFISVDTLEGCAKKVVAMAKECGVLFTPAGATYPYRVDPEDKNIRIAPTFPPLSDLKIAAEIFCVCVKIVSLEKLLNK